MYYSKQHKHRSQINLVYKISLFAGIAILILAFPLALILPTSVSFENGFLENSQVIVLLIGSAYNLFLIGKSIDRQIEAFHIWCSVMMIFMAFRELSWGRVFYPIALEETGPIFVAMSDFDWKIEAYVLIVFFLLFLILFMLRNLPLARMWNCSLPLTIIIEMIIAIIFSYIGDHGMFLGKLQGQIVEEFGELAFYVLIPALCIHYHRELTN